MSLLTLNRYLPARILPKTDFSFAYQKANPSPKSLELWPCTLKLKCISQSRENTGYIEKVIKVQVSLAKWLSVRLRTKCLWVRVQLQSLNKTSLFSAIFHLWWSFSKSCNFTKTEIYHWYNQSYSWTENNELVLNISKRFIANEASILKLLWK